MTMSLHSSHLFSPNLSTKFRRKSAWQIVFCFPNTYFRPFFQKSILSMIFCYLCCLFWKIQEEKVCLKFEFGSGKWCFSLLPEDQGGGKSVIFKHFVFLSWILDYICQLYASFFYYTASDKVLLFFIILIRHGWAWQNHIMYFY